jgi:hypothetical protein
LLKYAHHTGISCNAASEHRRDLFMPATRLDEWDHFELSFLCGHRYHVHMPMPAVWEVDVERQCPLCDPLNPILRDGEIVPLNEVLS